MTETLYVLEKQLPAPCTNKWEATGYFKTIGAAAAAFHRGHGHRRMSAWIDLNGTDIVKVLKQV